MADQGTRAEAVSAPAGNGLAAGLGEAFTLDLNTGQGCYAVAFTVPEGIAGFRPQLKLQYHNGAVAGPFGTGWTLPLRSIDRRLDFGIADGAPAERFTDGGADLVDLGAGEFRLAVESAFTRYRRHGDGWLAEERTGLRHELGTAPEARVADPGHPDRVLTWLLERSVDTSGNTITYTWDIAEGTPYLRTVSYAVYTLRLAYEDRPDRRFNGRAGFPRVLGRRCASVSLHAADRLVRRWELGYEQAEFSGTSLLTSVRLVSFGPAPDGSGDVLRPPQRFTYSAVEPDSWHAEFVPAADASPPPLTDRRAVLAPFGDGPLPGVLSTAGGRFTFWPTTGEAGFAPPRRVGSAPVVGDLRDDAVQVLDADGDARADLLAGRAVAGGVTGYYRGDGTGGVGGFVAYPRSRRAVPTLAPGAVRVADVDQDGRPDVLQGFGRGYAFWRNEAEHGWADPVALTVPGEDPTGGGPPDLADPLVRFADMTGDGAADLVRIRSGAVVYWPGLGGGRFGEPVLMHRSPRLPAVADPAALLLLDVDGDGCADLVRVDGTGVTVHPNRSGADFGPAFHDPLVPPPLPGTPCPALLSDRGPAGIAWNSLRNGVPAYVRYVFTPFAPLLTGVDNGAGLISRIHYTTASAAAHEDAAAGRPWEHTLPFPVVLVAATEETDTATGRRTQSRYRYHDGWYDPDNRQFQGFAEVEKTETGDTSRPDVRTVFSYRVAEDRRPGRGREAAALNRMLHRVAVHGADDARPYTVEESDHEAVVLGHGTDGRPRVWVRVTRTTRRATDRTDDERAEERTFTYDDDGNVIREVRRHFGHRDGQPQPDLVLTTDVGYATGRSRNLLDRVAHIVRRDGTGALLDETRRYYDGADHVGLPLGEAERGLLAREVRRVLTRAEFDAHYAGMDVGALGYQDAPDADGTPAVFAPTERHAHDSAGRVTADLSPTGGVTRFGYDATGLFQRTVTTDLGSTVTEFDPATGKPLRVTDPGGATVELSHDAQGRLTRVVLPGDTAELPTRTYAYDDTRLPNAVRVTHRLESGRPELALTAVYFDGWGHEIQRRTETAEETVLVSGHVVRNPWGDAVEEYEPTYAANLSYGVEPLAGRPARRFRYDALGRPVHTTDYGGGVSTAGYRPFTVETTDPNGATRIDRSDVARHRVSVVEQGATTTYEPSPLGRLLAYADDLGEVQRSVFDGLGNKLTLRHRDAGTRRCFYDAGSRMVRAVDGEGHDVAARFDTLDRLTALTVDGTERETYHYDAPGPGSVGRLRRVTYRGGAQSYRYDPQGRLVEHAHEFDGLPGAQILRFGYDAQGRRTSVEYPDGSTVVQEYHRNGVPKAVRGFVDEVDYDPRLLVTRIRYANGVTTTVDHTPGAGRVRHQRTTAPGGTVLDDRTLDYDAATRLLAVTEPTRTLTFTYDPLSQLTGVTDSAAQEATSYTYGPGRALTHNGENGLDLHYDDPQHPGRISRLTGEATDLALRHDLNGNLLALPGRSFTFDDRNRLARVDRDDGTVVTYGYDHTGRRVRKQVTAGGVTTDTLLLGVYAEVRDGQLAKYVVMGGSRVALEHQGAVSWIHTDPLGSVTFYTDSVASPLARIAYTAFGNARPTAGKPWSQVFALHELDTDSGLYHTQRRWYAPEVGRFVSPDGVYLHRPEKGADQPATLALYTYCANDPANRVDPDGGSFWTVVGGIVGVVVAVVVAVVVVVLCFMGVGFALLALAGLIMAVTGCYLLASANQGTAFGDFMKGFLIGLNAGLNAAIWTALGMPWLGAALGVINFLAVFDGVRQNPVYQGILGWSNWLMPMSWLVNGLGLIFFVLNVLPALVTGNQVDALKITYIRVDWATGSIITKGGWLSDVNTIDSAFDMGNFVYVDSANTAPDDDIPHELGHNLSLGAFGSIIHLVGFVDEMTAGGANAWTERMADSHSPSRRAAIRAAGGTPDDTWG